MKPTIIAILVFIIPEIIKAQCTNQYQLNLSDPTTFNYDPSCSSANPAQWDLKNDSCYIETSLLEVESTANIPINIKLNLSGNLECDDLAWIQYDIDGAGFVTDTSIRGCDHASVFDYFDTISMTQAQTIQIRIIGKTNEGTEVWQVKNGNISVCATMVVLPVEIVNFNAKKEDDKIMLSWTTLSEINSDYFLIEKSSNGITFNTIANIKAAGNSNTAIPYSFLDDALFAEINYYKLTQFDFDGKSSYSEIIVFVNNLNPYFACELNVNPNPCIERCSIIFNNCGGSKYSEVRFAIFDALGNVVYSSVKKELENGSASFAFDVKNNLKPGMYYIRGGAENLLNKKVILKN